jgi:hypothetical protein
MTVRRFLAAAALSLFAVGCSGQSGYNIDVRNDTNEPIALDLKTEKKNEQPKVVDTFHVGAGATSRHFTQIDSKSKVTLEAQVEGETARPAATMPLTLGETHVDVVPQHGNAVSDPKSPRVRLREREGH